MFSASSLRGQNGTQREIEAIVAPLVVSINNQQVRNVAISDFTRLNGTSTKLGKYLAEVFSLSLINAKKSFNFIDRSKVEALLKENNFDTTGLINPNEIAKLGKMKGIDAIIAGTMIPVDNKIQLFVKVWKLETQEFIAASEGIIIITPMIMNLDDKELLGGNNNSSPQNSTKSTKVGQDDFIIELIECKRQNENLQIKLEVISKKQDGIINIVGYHTDYGENCTMVFDNQGNNYKVQSIKIAQKTITMNSNTSGLWGKKLVKGVPTEIILIFNDFKSRADTIPLLKIVHKTDGSITSEFKDIKID